MASGKSTIAKIVSTRLEIPHFDLDVLVENETNLSVSSLFKEKGEIYFRKVEHTLFKNLLKVNQSLIISTGGGTPCYANNHLLLDAEDVVSIYLKGSIDSLYERLVLEKNQRPLVAENAEDDLK